MDLQLDVKPAPVPAQQQGYAGVPRPSTGPSRVPATSQAQHPPPPQQQQQVWHAPVAAASSAAPINSSLNSSYDSSVDESGFEAGDGHEPIPAPIQQQASRGGFQYGQAAQQQQSAAARRTMSPSRRAVSASAPSSPVAAQAPAPSLHPSISTGSLGSGNGHVIGTSGTVFDGLASSSEIVRVAGASYLRLACIGRGGSSRVYRVLGEDMCLYALKRVRLARMDAASVDNYRNEINLLKRLSGSHHIIRLLGAEVSYETRCIHMVMECGQADLNALLQGEKERAMQRAAVSPTPDHQVSLCLDENQLRLVWQQMLEAVQTIHEARIVHGDLKPANFVFVDGVLKLIDFGIAKAINNDTTNIVRDSQVGTINYMSPEAICDVSGKSGGAGAGLGLGAGRSRSGPVLKLGRASDIWSLGCILYQMAYGRTPFADLSLIQKLHAICDPNYAIAFPDCGNPALVAVMQGCLQRDPAKRPPIIGVSGLLQHEFLRPQIKLAATAAAPPPALAPIPAGAVLMSQAQLAQILASALSADRSSRVASSEINGFATEVAGAVAASPDMPTPTDGDDMVQTQQPLPSALSAAIMSAARKRAEQTAPAAAAAQALPRPPAPAAALAAAAAASAGTSLRPQAAHQPQPSNNENANAVRRVPVAAAGAPSGPASTSGKPAAAAPLAHAGGLNLQAALLSKAAALKHVDKENLHAEKAAAAAAAQAAAVQGDGGSLLAAVRRGLADRFVHVHAGGDSGDTTEMNVTSTWS